MAEEIIEIQKMHFNKIAEEYVKRIDTFSYNYYFNFTINEIINSLKRNSRNLKECVGLDLGCGTGDLTATLMKECKKMVGCDLSEGMINEATRNHNGIKFIQMQSDKLVFDESSFDFVVSTHLFHHLADEKLIEKTILEMKRVTKNNGLLIIVDLNKLNPASALIQYLMVKNGVDTGKEKLIFPRKLLSIFRKHNIRKVDYKGFCFIPHFFAFAVGMNKFLDIGGINKLIGKDYIIAGIVMK